MIPAEIIFDSLIIESYQEEANTKPQMEELDLVESRREVAQIRAEKYKSQVRAQFNKKVKAREVKKEDLVLKRAYALKPLTKWATN